MTAGLAVRVPWRPSRTIVVALVVAALAGCAGEPTFRGVAMTPPRAVGAFQFVQATGDTLSTAPEPGRPMVLFFGYTHCPDVCPTTMSDWKRARAKLGRRADQVRFVFVTVDPARDTPQVADRYAKQFDASFIGVSGDTATTTRIMASFGVAAARESGSDTTARNYLVSHSAQAFLVDDTGRVVAMYPFGIGWDALAADLAMLL